MKKQQLAVILSVIWCLLVALFLIFNTRAPLIAAQDSNTTRGIYYWKTVFRLTNSERQFLTTNNVNKLYLRLFDVVVSNDGAVPNATIAFADSIPCKMEVVPTIFITTEVLSHYQNKHDLTHILPAKIATRIDAMCRANGIDSVREWQIDCDWTRNSETIYFDFLRTLKQIAAKRGVTLSATIRLHQFVMSPPPVDRGMLMCYNTGAIKDIKTKNSIIASDQVAMYAQNIKKFNLPLDVAYPNFSWAILFRNGAFFAILRDLEISSPNLEIIENNNYRVVTPFTAEKIELQQGDKIRYENSPYDEIMKSKLLLEAHLSNNSTTLYHLDSTNFSKYNQNEISAIYGN